MEDRLPVKTEAENINEYLLGELPEHETEMLEERFFADDDLYEEIQAAEMALIDRYVRNGMPAAERDRFEEKFLITPERRAKVAESRRFHSELHALRVEQNVARESVDSRSWFERTFGRFGLALNPLGQAAAVLMIVMALGIGWLIYDRWRVGQQLMLAQNTQRESEANINAQIELKERELRERLAEQGNADSETQAAIEGEIEQLQRDLEEARKSPSANRSTPERVPTIATIMLLGTRGGGAPTPISLNKETKVLNLRIAVVASEDAFDVTVSKGPAVVSRAVGLTPRATGATKTLSVNIPARQLTDGQYDVLIRNKAGEEMKRSFVVKRN
jgi:hypothetical protein